MIKHYQRNGRVYQIWPTDKWVCIYLNQHYKELRRRMPNQDIIAQEQNTDSKISTLFEVRIKAFI